ncbi:MAG: chemotaxis protein CheD [Gemmatimonadaceae bacterium]|nr:chemotaxis protein CheD [Gemmatimonadaceae bacterium]
MTTLLAPQPAPDIAAAARTITVPMGRMAVAHSHEQLRTIGLGSCVAIVIFAPTQRIAALAHCMLPQRDDVHEPVSKYSDTSVPALLDLLHESGASEPFAAALVGGASMFPGVPSDFMHDLAGSTVRAARKALADASIPVRVEDVGGHVGRSVVIEPSTQRVMVRTIRDGERWL